MPKVPQAERTVRTVEGPDVYQRSTASPQSMGVGVGQSLQGVGDMTSRLALDELALQNETRTKELDVEFNGSLRALQFAPQSGYYNRKGQDAFESAPVFEQATEELRLQFLEKADNPSQARMLDQVMQQRISRAKDGVSRHAQKEYQSWINGAAQARINDSIQDSIVNYNNPEFLQTLRASGRNEILTRAERTGQDPAVTQEELRLYDSDIHAGTVTHLIQIDPREAEAYFEEHKDAIDGTKHATLRRALRVAKHGDLATDWAHYSELATMSVENQTDFITLNLDEYDLSNSHRAYFMNLQRTVLNNRAKGNEQVRSMTQIRTLAKSSLEAAGINTTPKGEKRKKRLDSFYGAALEELEYYRSTHDGRDPTEIEMQEIIDRLLIKGSIPGSGLNVLGTTWFEDEAFMFESEEQVLIPLDEVPDADREAIRAAYRAEAKRDPTDEEIRQTYTESQLRGQ